MDKMIGFIAMVIEDARDISLLNGQAKYRAYFINTTRYERFRLDVESILTIDGYDDCIVTV